MFVFVPYVWTVEIASGKIAGLTCFIDALLFNNTKDNMDAMKTMGAEDQSPIGMSCYDWAYLLPSILQTQ
eukprot:1286101-Amphidinium_carterae.1